VWRLCSHECRDGPNLFEHLRAYAVLQTCVSEAEKNGDLVRPASVPPRLPSHWVRARPR
jgi:hypothetical protein